MKGKQLPVYASCGFRNRSTLLPGTTIKGRRFFGVNPEPSRLNFRQVFADALEVNTTLKELVLNKNGIGAVGTQVLQLCNSDCSVLTIFEQTTQSLPEIMFFFLVLHKK